VEHRHGAIVLLRADGNGEIVSDKDEKIPVAN